MNPNLLKLIPENTKRVLETGCADGQLGAAIKASHAGIEVIGIELLPEKAREAQIRLDRVIVGDAELMTLPEDLGEIDCLIYADSIEHMKEPEAVLRKHLAALKDDGVVVVSIPNVRNIFIIDSLLKGNWTYTEWGLLDKTHFHLFTLSEFLKMAHACGLEADHIEPSFRDGDWFKKMHPTGQVEDSFCAFYQRSQSLLQSEPAKCAKELETRYGYVARDFNDLVEFYSIQFHMRLRRMPLQSGADHLI